MSKRNDDAKSKKPLQDTDMHFRLNRLLQSNTVLAITVPIMAIFLFLAGCYVVHAVTDFFKLLVQKGLTGDLSKVWKISQAIHFQNSFQTLYIVWGILVLVLMACYVYQVKMGYGDLNRGHHGHERWTTPKELRQQYLAIPEKSASFKGYGGIPISREGKKLLIDSGQAVNSLIIGLTRSGKGEMYSFPTIDTTSRAEQQCSMVITDPKLELAAGSIPTLEARGYECHILNLVDPLVSMGYNPLSLIIDAYKERDYGSAEMLCGFLSFTIYHEESVKDPFWNDNAANVLSALILAHVDDALQMDALENAQAEISFYCRQRDFLKLKPENQQKVRDAIALGEEALLCQQKVLLAQEKQLQALLDQQAGEVLKLRDRLEQNSAAIRKIGRQIMYTQRYVLPEVNFVKSTKHEDCVNIASIYNTFSMLARRVTDEKTGRTALDDYFANRPGMDRAKLKYAAVEMAPDRTKASVFSVALSKLSLFSVTPFARMTAESTLQMREIGFGEKPIAVFIAAPDFDQSFHFLASIFIRQLYFVLAKYATLERGGKCKRRVTFLLDEFGNLPAIENMANIITVSLGRDIQFILTVQALEQLKKLYGEDTETIIGNCGNQIYVMSSSKSTAKEFSEMLGNETIVEVSRDGNKMDIKKHFHESTISRPLLDENELMRLRRGETVVRRSMLREDLKGKDIDPYPIFNTGDSKMIYRHEYLIEDFPANCMITDIPGLETRAHIDERSRVLNIDRCIEELQGKPISKEQIKQAKESRNLEPGMDEAAGVLHSSPLLSRMPRICGDVMEQLDGIYTSRDLAGMTRNQLLIDLEIKHKEDIPKEKRMKLYEMLITGFVQKEEEK